MSRAEAVSWAGGAMHFAAEHAAEFAEFIQSYSPPGTPEPIDPDRAKRLVRWALSQAHDKIAPGCPEPIEVM
jgi:hypothetical protein